MHIAEMPSSLLLPWTLLRGCRALALAAGWQICASYD
jgi:hypothetical protein